VRREEFFAGWTELGARSRLISSTIKLSKANLVSRVRPNGQEHPPHQRRELAFRIRQAIAHAPERPCLQLENCGA